MEALALQPWEVKRGVWNGDRMRAHWSQRSWRVKGKRVSFESLSKKTLRLCHSSGLDCIPQNVYWSPNPCYLRRWIYLKMSSLQLQLVKVMSQKCWAPINLIRSGLLKDEAEPDWSGQWSEPWAPGGSLGKTVIPRICVFIEVLGSFGKLCTTITVVQWQPFNIILSN